MLAGLEKGLHIAPDNPSEASFKDALFESGKPALNGSGYITHSAMTVLCREFGVLIPKYDDVFLASLSDIWDNPPSYTSPRRTSKTVNIEAPTVNILAAATPAALSKFPESAWGEGFCSRVIFVYGTQNHSYRDVFKKREATNNDELRRQLREFYNDLHGEFEWEEPAREAFNNWLNIDRCAPVPSHPRLVYYNTRREVFILKLSMISAVSAGHGMTITLDDFCRAQSWLFEEEKSMPDVFRALTQKSDKQLYDEVHHFVYVKYSSVGLSEREPVDEIEVRRFLEDKATSERIPIIIDTMIKNGRLRNVGGGFGRRFVPNTMDLN